MLKDQAGSSVMQSSLVDTERSGTGIESVTTEQIMRQLD